jgi:2-keto-4-pentenoate hydratase/2-oxohepta-3-ene-1,7-dioic acid hydratase in catechol pathway
MTAWVRFEGGFGTLADGQVVPHQGDMFGASQPCGPPIALAELILLAPVMPGKFIGLWNNFHALAAKLGQAIPQTPLFFLKATSAILAPGGIIRPPPGYAGKTVYEGELGIVIGRSCHGADEAEASAAIFGYTCVNDVTALDLIHEDASFPQWARAKSCDTFGPVGPAIVTGLNPSSLTIRTVLNGRERQNYPVSDMILPPARIVSLLSREMTLLPGDLIACGTSMGVLPMRPGAEVSVMIDRIGTLTNRFEAAEATPG